MPHAPTRSTVTAVTPSPAWLLALLLAALLVVGAAVPASTPSASGAEAEVRSAPASMPTAVGGPLAPRAAPVDRGPSLRELRRTLRRELRAALVRADEGRRVPRRTTPGLPGLRLDKETPPEACTAEPPEWRHDICVLGDPRAERTVVLLGNSHMNMWMNGLADVAEAQGVRVVPLIKWGCAPYRIEHVRSGRPWGSCSRFQEWAQQQVDRLQPDQVVMATHRNFDLRRADGAVVRATSPRADSTWRRGVRATVRQMRADTDRVTVLGSINFTAQQPKACLERNARLMQPCEETVSAETQRHNAVLADAVARAGADFVDVVPLNCLRGRCPVAAAGRYTYRNYFHVTAGWSAHVGRLLAAEVGLAGPPVQSVPPLPVASPTP